MEDKVYKCKYCNKEFNTVFALCGHIGHCECKPGFDSEKYHLIRSEAHKKSCETAHKNFLKTIKTYTFKCKQCGKEYTQELSEAKFKSGHYLKYCSRSCANKHIYTEETKQKISAGVKNFAKTKLYELSQDDYEKYVLSHIKPIDELKNKNNISHREIVFGDHSYKIITYYKCKTCGKILTQGQSNYIYKGKPSLAYCSKECAHTYMSTHCGGYRENSAHAKGGWYKGIYCDSTWELAFVIYHLDHNLKIKRCKEYRTYTYKGKTYKYYPDFITDDGIIEIKGWYNEKARAKSEQHRDIIIIGRNEIKKYLNYVHNKYGGDIKNLYDDVNPNERFSVKNRKYIWVHKGSENKMIKVQHAEQYFNDNWIRGRTLT